MMKFNLQMFADTVSSSVNLKTEFGFVDGDTRTVNIPEPITGIDSDTIVTFSTWISENQPIVGDKYGASTTGVNSAIKVEEMRTKLDLT